MMKQKYNLNAPAFAVIDLKYCDIHLKDGGTEDVIIKVGEGTLSFTETKNHDYMLNRGVLDTVREGDEAPVEWSLDISWNNIQGDGTTDVSDGISLIRGIVYGDDGYTTTDTDDACAAYSFDILVEYRPTCDSGAQDISITYCRLDSFQGDIGAGTLQLSGKANITRVSITAAAST